MLGLQGFTLLHVAISMIGIGTGFVVLADMLRSRFRPRWTAWFLGSTIGTSVSGFLFPFVKFLPSHAFGILSLLVFAIVLPALYRFRLAGRWRAVYVSGALFTLYLNVFVLIVQLFLKVPALRAIAPTQEHPVFAAAQGVNLVAFIVLGLMALKRFHPSRAG